jgi:cellulose synthase/poly-beta-1,6-N-acetylglucosamine synthase-like glycosyltransferase
MTWSIFTLLVTLFYVILIAFYHFHWRNISVINEAVQEAEFPFVSIIVVGRNEGENLTACINSIVQNDFPVQSYEIIYVDDHSEDDSLEKLNAIKTKQLEVLCLKDYEGLTRDNKFKKQAIEYALTRAKGDLILHTDADTIVGKRWIRSHAISYAKGNVFSAAPVVLEEPYNFLTGFQMLDVLTTMAVTGGGIKAGMHYLANGANMSYDAKARQQIKDPDGYVFASGDDVFLIQSFRRLKIGPISFLADPEAIVETKSVKRWRAFFNQRFRWAGKSRGYRDGNLLFVEALVFFMNLSLLINGLLLVLSLVGYHVFLTQIILKLLTDVLFIRSASSKLGIKTGGKYILPAFLFFPVYYLIIGISTFLPIQRTWKGRQIH